VQPLVSVAMPARNAQATVALTIRSLLGQTYTNWELFIVDDGSNDDTMGIARGFDDQRIHLQAGGRRLGLAARLNQIMDRCSGDYFARLDADDIAYPERLQRQVDFLLHHESVDLLGAGAMVFDKDGSAIGLFPVHTGHAEICRHPWSGFYLAHPTWMGRIAWFRRHRYRPEMTRAQDQDLLLRTYRSSTFACLPETLGGYRQETLSLRKIIAGRMSFSKALIRQAGIERRYVRMVSGPVKQAGKSVLDTLAISSGMGRRLLRHRALAASDAERARWSAVWAALQTPSDPL
jgi:glycosyltransferase involved in cell wall biosynthesis